MTAKAWITDNEPVTIATLRTATEADHRRVEAALPLMDERLTRDGYRTVLERLHGLVSGWESLLEACASPTVRDLARARARLSLLERDLEFLSGNTGDRWSPGPCAAWDQSRLLGAMYVMEGSRLGGQLIAKRLEGHLGLVPGEGDAYFRGFGARTAAMWKEFTSALEAAVPDGEASSVIAGAKSMFSTFEAWMRGGAIDLAVPATGAGAKTK